MIILFAILFTFLVSGPAAADPVSAAIVTAFKAVGAWKIGTFAIGQFILRTAVSVGISLLAGAANKQKQKPSGVRSPSTMAGESTSATLIFGRYATGGTMVCPPMTDGRTSRTPNIYLTYVIDLSDMPVASLDGIWVGDEQAAILAPDPGDDEFPSYHRLGGKFLGWGWVKFFDGTQTTAYQGLIDTDGNGRPWLPDMIGRGIPYAVVRFRYRREVYQGPPSCVFEVNGIGFYDPRKDSTVGGSGAHRWGQRSTYEPSENPYVQIYNVLRGIEIEDGSRWGGECEAEDLPLDNWFAAMNDADVPDADGRPRWRSSYEVKIGPEDMGGDEPAGVIEDILRGVGGQISEFGGVYKVRAGGPGLPVIAFTDEDVVITSEQSLRPFKGLQETYNGVQAQYPEPRELWASKEAPPRYNATWELQDQGRRLVASLSLPTVPYADQVQRVMQGYIRDARRDTVLDLTLPPDFAAVEPLDSVAYTSALNGFSAKVFEVRSRADDMRTLLQQMTLRERDSSDWVWQPSDRLPDAVGSPTTVTPGPRVVLDFDAHPIGWVDDDGITRRAGIRMTWDPDQPDARALRYQIRAQGQAATFGGSVHAIEEGEFSHYENILGETAYQVRGILVTRRSTIWTDWINVVTGAAGIAWADFEAGLRGDLEEADRIAREAEAEAIRANEAAVALRSDLDTESAALRARADEIEAQALIDLQVSRDYTETMVEVAETNRRTADDALAARIVTLTAVLNSDNLLRNPQFMDGLDGWTVSTASATSVVAQDTASSDPVVAGAPTARFVRITGHSTSARVLSQTFDLAWGEDDVLQWRVRGAADNAQSAQARVQWFDAAGVKIGSTITNTLSLSAGQWRAYSGKHEPPTGTARVLFDLRLAATAVAGTVAFADVAVSTLDESVLAEIESLSVVVADNHEAFTLHRDSAISRLDAAEGAIEQESLTRADEIEAIADQQTVLSASVERKTRTFDQPTAPANNSTNALTVGDIWYDSDNGNRPYRWSGSAWVEKADTRVGTINATVNTHGTAIANLEDGAKAGYLVKVQAGGAVSLLDLVAADGSGGAPTSIARISADDILLNGSVSMPKLLVGDLANRVTDPSCLDLANWQVLPGAPALVRWTSTTSPDAQSALAIYSRNGAYSEFINSPVAYQTPRAGNGFAVSAGEVYYVRARVHKLNAGNSAITAHLGLRVSNGLDTDSSSSFLKVTYDFGIDNQGWRTIEGFVTIPSDVNGLKPAFALVHGGISNTATADGVRILFTEMTVRRAADSVLIQDGAVMAKHIVSDEVRALMGRFISLEAANIRVGSAEIDTIHIKGDALYVPYFFSRADVTLTASSGASNRVTLFDRTIPDFEGGGYLVSFNAYFDTTNSVDAYGAVEILIDNTRVSLTRFGARGVGSADVEVMLPINLYATASGDGATNIKVRAWNSHWDDISWTSNTFSLRSPTLGISGSRR